MAGVRRDAVHRAETVDRRARRWAGEGRANARGAQAAELLTGYVP
ncbi:hypothetical protein V6U90_24210 [Micromonospora sp. CPCC 206060]